ncbi:Piso0_005538 [Millerozyma farinosa CBS 7064]|uniref:Piso0_005538 protein n=1 Tax=Pichia sorbitophila (strain ATCC MYA-4447 / BCRC 22081 / CBS 7064 / NBRC 10061 / NRRL Y-12695) TaxID=559304 RepID=G8Y289_PICSO|nr:Piso0_005538 [Millerozyma farinosa CBS 7064]
MKNGNTSQVKDSSSITDPYLGKRSTIHTSTSKERVNIEDGTLNGYDKNLSDIPYKRETIERSDAYQEKAPSKTNYQEDGSLYKTNLDRDSMIFKGIKRTKLSGYDLKLILYLIIKIKPFKYIGEKSLSQTKKWESIQTKFADMKSGIGNESSNSVIPTIRTLQRQLANTIRKTKLKASKDVEKYQDDSATYAFINSLNLGSSVEELEMAVLRLHELSEKFKSGQGSTLASLTSSSSRSPPSSFMASKELPVQPQDKEQSHASDTPRRTDGPSNGNGSLDERLKTTRDKLRNTISSDAHSPHQLFELVNLFVDQVSEFNSLKQEENRQVSEETNMVIQQQQTRCKRIIEQNQQLIKEQDNLSKQLMSDILSHLSNRPGPQSGLSV